MDLILSSRFDVTFFGGGVLPNLFDIRFQRVSGLSTSIELTSLNEGGENLYVHRLPKRATYGNLLLERGFVVGSPLNLEFNLTMSMFKFVPSLVLVTLLDQQGMPLAAWRFLRAFPVRWSTADLSANEDRVLVDTMELAYASMQAMRV